MKRRKCVIFWSFVFVCSQILLSSCNTGIETTKTIKMSKSDKKVVQPSDEEIFATQFKADPLADWLPGRQFLVADQKAALILDSESGHSFQDLTGKRLSYKGVKERKTAGENDVCVIMFENPEDGELYGYNTSKSFSLAAEAVTGLDIPTLIDLEIVLSADSILIGRNLWTQSTLWYDSDFNPVKGQKFVKVTVKNVLPGNLYFPLIIEFEDQNADSYFYYMNIKDNTGIGAESRTFSNLFSLTDPKLKYPSISTEIWEKIQNGKVALGMTKEECKLSLGTPADVDSGHDWNSTIDIWRYKDGTFLQFKDGLLVNYRH